MAKKAKSSLFAKHGTAAKKAFNRHKKDSTKLDSGGELPPNLEGVARLTDIKFDKYKTGENEGEYYFLANGVCVAPDIFAGVKCKGKYTQIMEPMCDTPTRTRPDFDAHFEWVLNQLRLLGVETKELDPDDLEEVMAALKDSGIYFDFRTWQGKPTESFPNPGINSVWKGINEEFVPDDGDDGVEDNTGDDDEDEEDEEEEAEDAEDSSTEEDEDDSEGGSELDILAAAADDNDDRKAQLKLTKLAKTHDIDPEELESWAAVVEAINEAETGGSEEEEAEEDEEEEDGEEEDAYKPTKGDVCKYKPPKSRKQVECEVTAISTGKETATLKSMADGKTLYKGVPWSKLEAVDDE